MSGINKTIILGRLGADPEIRTTQNGSKVANMRIATSETWKDKNTGEKKEATEWHTVTVWGDQLVGVVERYLAKGNRCFVEGKLTTRKWQDQQGNDRYSTEVVVQGFGGRIEIIDFKDDGVGAPARSDSRINDDWQGGGSIGKQIDDEIPF